MIFLIDSIKIFLSIHNDDEAYYNDIYHNVHNPDNNVYFNHQYHEYK